MLPLSDKQIGLFVRKRGVEKPAELVEKVDRQQAWPFARRPLDLIDLVAKWKHDGLVGTRVEQHEANIQAKLIRGDPERKDSGVLADDEARHGAERLALALALTRTRTVLSPDLVSETETRGVLDAPAILADWTQEKRNALLRRGLFDPATYGRVRFHHRSVQEYMAACRLRALREQGMSKRSLFQLLFSERYGVQVAVPSMRPIAAWLALWDVKVRQEMLKREPKTLLSFGSPGMLDLATRRAIVYGICGERSARGSLRLSVSIGFVRQLANPGLGSTIGTCWGDDIVNSDIGRFLLHLIQFGRVKDCADLARTAALSEVVDPYHRVIAIQALIACGEDQAVQDIVDTMLSSTGKWPNRVVGRIIADFPQFMSVNELVFLVERTPETKYTAGGFEWTLQEIARGIGALSEESVDLRNGLADLVWRKRQGTQIYDLHSSVHHVIPALSVLCMKHLDATPNNLDGELVRACVIASRFGKHTLGGDVMEVEKLKSAFPLQSKAREDAFWMELQILDEVSAEANEWERLHYMQSGLIGHLLKDDRPWLEKALSHGSHSRRRRIALHALLDLWRQAGRPQSKLSPIRECLEDDEALVQTLEREIAPLEESDALIRMKRDTRNHCAEAQHREEQRVTEWCTWRDNVRSDPDGAFSSERVNRTRHKLYNWLLGDVSQIISTSRRVWNRGALAHAFGEKVADLAECAFRDFWRRTKPLPPSQRPFGERNTPPGSWVMGLNGIYAEASRDGWTDSLSSDEARRAATYATLELNGFPSYITSLANSHPQEVKEVLGGEISFELRLDEGDGHLSSLQNLRRADSSVRNLLTPRLIQEMRSWPPLLTGDTELRQAKRLDQLIGVLSKTEDATERETITEICACRYKVDPFCPSALAWLKGLFRFDAEQA